MSKYIQCSNRVAGLTLALLWLFQASAVAGIYKWRDDQGKLHYTDDRAKIPLKYRESVQKFKGVTELKPKEEAPPEKEQEEPKSEKETSAAVEPSPEETPKSPALPPLTEEEKATMTAVYQPLVKMWKGHVSLLMDGEAVDKKLDKYIATAQSSVVDKKSIAKTIGKIQNPLLVEIKTFVKKSGKKDARLKGGSPNSIDYARFYKKRLKKEIPIENEFIRKLRQRLELKTPSPLITLEEATRRFAERKALVKRNMEMNNERNKNPNVAADGTRF